MDKKTQLIIYLLIVILAIGLVYVAYLIDSGRIASNADTESNVSAQNVTELTSPDQSIMTDFYTKIYSTIISPFTK